MSEKREQLTTQLMELALSSGLSGNEALASLLVVAACLAVGAADPSDDLEWLPAEFAKIIEYNRNIAAAEKGLH